MRRRWCPQQRQQYAQHLSNNSRLADFVARNEQQNVQQASELVFGAVADAATVSSMPLRRMRPGIPCGPKQFSDPDADALRSQMWRLRHQPGQSMQLRVLESECRSLVRRKMRALLASDCRLQSDHLRTVMQQIRREPHAVYGPMKGRPKPLPLSMQATDLWEPCGEAGGM